MQILHIILSLMGIVAYVVTALFAFYAFGKDGVDVDVMNVRRF